MPKRARPNAWETSFVRRAFLAVSCLFVACLAVVRVLSTFEPEPLAGFGPTASYHVMRPWYAGCWLSHRVTVTTPVPPGTFWVSVPMQNLQPVGDIIDACGCRFRASSFVNVGPAAVSVWRGWPRSEPSFRVEAGGRWFDVENPGACVSATVPREAVTGASAFVGGRKGRCGGSRWTSERSGPPTAAEEHEMFGIGPCARACGAETPAPPPERRPETARIPTPR